MLAGALTTTVVGGGLFGVSAMAATNNTDDTLAGRIATKFNLNKDDVQKVVTDYRSEQRTAHQADHHKKLEERLTQAVKDGKITEAQKTKILDYLKSQQSFFDSLKDKSEADRKTAMEAHRSEVKKWAADNGIDEQYVLGMGPGRGHMGPPPADRNN